LKHKKKGKATLQANTPHLFDPPKGRTCFKGIRLTNV
jgi:hypothetical protein